MRFNVVIETVPDEGEATNEFRIAAYDEAGNFVASNEGPIDNRNVESYVFMQMLRAAGIERKY